MANKYDALTNEFFDRMEADVNELKNKKKTTLIVSGAGLGIAALSLLISTLTSGTAEIVFIALLIISAIVCIMAFRKSRDIATDLYLKVSDYDHRFYDEVFINMIGSELGCNALSQTVNNDYHLDDLYEGFVLDTRDVKLEGNVNGRNISYSQRKENVVTKVKTDSNNNFVVDYKSNEEKDDIIVSFTSRRTAPARIGLSDPDLFGSFRGDGIKMDDKNFRFEVTCEDELAAYKYFTADVLEELQDWNENGHIHGITLEGNSKADNNLIHDWSEIYQTYQPAVTLKGVGNVCSHNEIYNSPHEAISYFGNNQLIEYNLIYNVCLLSDDAGAIYAGRRWDFYGTVIRYNCIHDIGSGTHTPDGIYFDDALSGQTAYGNLLVNIPKYGFHLGGGRDLIVKNNIIVNTGVRAVSYDDRAIEGVNGGWFTHSATIDSDMWQNLLDSPWQSEIWQEAYPQMKSFSTDFGNQDDPGFVPNPAGSDVSGNLIINLKGSIGMISESAAKYSNISGNAIFNMFYMNSIFTDYSSGDYTLKQNSPLYRKLPDFEALPLDKIGRY